MIATCEYGEEVDGVPPAPSHSGRHEGLSDTTTACRLRELHWITQATKPHRHRHMPFEEKLTTAEEAISKVLSDQRVYIGGNCGEPRELLNALVKRADTLRNVEVIHVLTVGPVPYVDPEQASAFRANVFFIGQNMRDPVQ